VFTMDIGLERITRKDSKTEGGPLTVLIIDDAADFTDMFSMILDYLGCRTYRADSGADGLDLARRIRPDAVFCELSLPDQTGLEVARQLREQAGLRDVYLVAMTAAADVWRPGDIEQYFDMYMQKPIRTSALKEMLDAAAARLRV
jgi:CheY-like chemotaxis protein